MKHPINLIDCKNERIKQDDIVKVENLETGKIAFYLYDNKFLYKYDEDGNIEERSLDNIVVDGGVKLINNETSRWTRLGTKDEVYEELFK